MTNWLSGMRLTSDRMNDATLKTSTTTGATASAGFTLVSFSGRKVNGITTIRVTCTKNGTVSEGATNTGNIADTPMATLPVGWRPPEVIECIWNNGFNDGGATIGTNGVITLRTTSGNTALGDTTAPSVNATWISENA